MAFKTFSGSFQNYCSDIWIFFSKFFLSKNCCRNLRSKDFEPVNALKPILNTTYYMILHD